MVVAVVMLGTGLTSSSSGDLQSQIAASKSAAASLSSQIAADSALIQRTTHGLADANRRLGTLQLRLTAREEQLRSVQNQLLAARNRLVDLENQLQRATSALAANLVANYEQAQPNLVTVILEAHGFTAAGRASELHAPDRRAERAHRGMDARDPLRRVSSGEHARHRSSSATGP